MESSRNKKRGYEQSVEDEADGMPGSKKSKLPALASVIVEALKMDSLQRLCSSLEPLLRRIVSEEVERALTKFGHAKLAARSPPPRIHGPGEKNLQLHFKTSMPPHLFTGGKVEGDQGAAIHVVLIDMNTGDVVQTGPESSAKLNVVVLEGDFNEEEDDNWTKEHFESHEVKEREGKRPILTGDLLVTLKEGFGTLGDLTFTDNSSWIRSRKFRLGLKVSPGYCDGIRVREAKTEGFAVKDHRGELYKKHYPPALHDEVWRLDRIAKDGALHKKLMKADIVTVEDFLRILVRDPQKLRNVSNFIWILVHSLMHGHGNFFFFYFKLLPAVIVLHFTLILPYRSLGVACPIGCGRTQWSMRRHVSWVGSFMFTMQMELRILVLSSTIFMSFEASLMMGSSSPWNPLLTARRYRLIPW
ncbi:hypothetical protein CICLE_v10008603mg [Citrus x clementina]|uniref:Uncharacterized protein n=1 Tax=Citrus clementina TaxID=85681 RepID=V4UW01_CITCL|nr:hypothetical protein CICLE_v10008603mg [Citrus x clementina]ESR66881.1 hypothetical protein CICLE_v10008603mg [Citrus x clementina]